MTPGKNPTSTDSNHDGKVNSNNKKGNADQSPIEIGVLVPRRQGPFSRRFIQSVMKLLGWKITGSLPNLSKFVLIGGPHTSNWDFVYGVLSMFSLGLDVHWIGKHTIFIPPFDWILRKFGGVPVNRQNPGTLFRDVLNGFENNHAFVLGLSPEGTRSKVSQWKPGFHRIAKSAGVPIVPAAIDFHLKVVHFGPPFIPTDNFNRDVEQFKAHFSSFTPKHPELY